MSVMKCLGELLKKKTHKKEEKCLEDLKWGSVIMSGKVNVRLWWGKWYVQWLVVWWLFIYLFIFWDIVALCLDPKHARSFSKM